METTQAEPVLEETAAGAVEAVVEARLTEAVSAVAAEANSSLKESAVTTLGSISEFLSEQHTYLAQSTMTMVESLRESLVKGYEERLAKQEAAHAESSARLRSELEDTQRQLSIAQNTLERLMGHKESVNWSTASRFLAGKQALSKKSLFNAWFKETYTAKADRLLGRVAEKRYHRGLVHRALNGWIRFVFGSKDARAEKRAAARLTAVSAEIVHRYEAELDKYRRLVTDLKAQLADGHKRRCSLEDELRRTLLKGMVSMNMEALSIFSANAADDRAAAAHTAELTQVGDDVPLPRAIAPQPSSVHAASHRY